jgi:hypothetical protein
MTISLDKPRQPPATLQRHDATWQDYEALRGDLQHIDDRSENDWKKLHSVKAGCGLIWEKKGQHMRGLAICSR